MPCSGPGASRGRSTGVTAPLLERTWCNPGTDAVSLVTGHAPTTLRRAVSGTPLRRRSRAWLTWVLAACVIAGGGYYLAKRRGAPPPTVRVHRARRGYVRDLVSTVAAGRVAAVREAALRAEVAGRVIHLHHRRGERVAAGEPLVTYDAEDLRDRVNSARTAVALAHAQAAQADASARLAARTAARMAGLRDHGAAAPAEVETLEGQADVAARALGAARAAEAQGAASVEIALTALRHAVVRAPFAGTVLTTSVEEGEVTAPGGPLLALADVSALHVDGELDEADMGRVALGMAAEVSLDAFPGERMTGRVGEIAPSVTLDTRGNRAVAIRVELALDPRLRVGMSADVDVVVATRDDVLAVPPAAVLGRGTDRSVYVIAGGRLHRRTVDVGIATWEAVEIRSGLRVGDEVVLASASDQLADGVVVTAREVELGGVAR